MHYSSWMLIFLIGSMERKKTFMRFLSCMRIITPSSNLLGNKKPANRFPRDDVTFCFSLRFVRGLRFSYWEGELFGFCIFFPAGRSTLCSEAAGRRKAQALVLMGHRLTWAA